MSKHEQHIVDAKANIEPAFQTFKERFEEQHELNKERNARIASRILVSGLNTEGLNWELMLKTDSEKGGGNSLKNLLLIKKLMEKQHPRQITGFETPNNNAADPSFKKTLD